MIKKITIEIPTDIIEKDISTREFFFNFINAILLTDVGRNSILQFKNENSPTAKRYPEKGEVIFSYHTFGYEKNVWHVKGTAIYRRFSIDSEGYSGYSSIADSEKFESQINMIDHGNAKSIILAQRKIFSETGVSNIWQSPKTPKIPDKFVFFPLQVLNDSVMFLNPFSVLELIEEAAKYAKENKVFLLIKRHPGCNSQALEIFLHNLAQQNSFIKITKGNIHFLTSRAHSVITMNSGVGLEALINGATVYTTAPCEWQDATLKIKKLSDIRQAFLENQPALSPYQEKLIAFLLSQYWVCADSIVDIKKKVEECFRTFDDAYGIIDDEKNLRESFIPIINELHSKVEFATGMSKKANSDAEIAIAAMKRMNCKNISLWQRVWKKFRCKRY